MNHPPRSEWDRLLQSTIRLRAGKIVPVDDRGGFCLYDGRSGRSFGLAPWQTLVLMGIEAERPFATVVREVVSEYPEQATPESIGDMLRGLVHHHLVEVTRRERIRTVAPPSPRGHWQRSRWPIFSRWAVGKIAIAALFVAGAWVMFHGYLNSASADSPLGFGEPAGAFSAMAWASEVGVPVRASCGGVIKEVLVRDGDAVRSGDILARIADPVAQATRDDLRRLMGECRVSRDAYYRAGDLVSYLRESKALARLANEVSEWELRSGIVDLRAPVDGLVHQRKFFVERVGDPVNPGDVLMTIEVSDVALRHGETEGLIAGMP